MVTRATSGRPAEMSRGAATALFLFALILLRHLGHPATAFAEPSFMPKVDYPMGSNPSTVAIADLNGDGIPDLATTMPNRNAVAVLLGFGDGTFGVKSEYGTGRGPQGIVIADLNNDEYPDLAVANSYPYTTPCTVSVLLGNGDGTFSTRADYPVGVEPMSVAVGDLNGDGWQDLAVANLDFFMTPSTVSVLLGNGDGTFGPNTQFVTANHPRTVAMGDLNADGSLDLVVTAETSDQVSVLLGNGDGTFRPRVDISAGSKPWFVTIGELSGDGALDLAIANYSDNRVSVLPGLGDGTFGTRTSFEAGNYPRFVSIGDLDADGEPDLVVASAGSNAVSVLPGIGNGTFGTHTEFATGSSPNSVAIGDLNRDGRLDLAVTNYWDSTVTVLLGVHEPVATEVSLAAVSAQSGLVRLEWFASTTELAARVYRRTEGSEWVELGRVHADGARYVRFEDRSVEAGHRYGYRLGVPEDGSEHFLGETWVETPFGPRFALEGLRPNPAEGALVVALSLPSTEPATLELLDLGGRRLLVRDLRGLGPGDLRVRLEPSRGLRPGIYFLKLIMNREVLTSRVCVLK